MSTNAPTDPPLPDAATWHRVCHLLAFLAAVYNAVDTVPEDYFDTDKSGENYRTAGDSASDICRDLGIDYSGIDVTQ